ncbi:unnamed protein product [Mytilus coruscus]|uniref:CCHC-type domain-containing protein n=1 Tax=Mytilus coruscus TaxID=42192 RepID=A0A6J8C6D6_MYTCO|nr:unnamed protein product [Mytilus coruscus]
MHSEIFQNLTLSSGQSVEDFYCQIYEKGKLLVKPEHEMLSKFISGLPEQMSFLFAQGCLKICKTPSLPQKWQKPVVIDDSVNAAGFFKNKSRDNRRTADDQNTKVRDLRQQIQELGEQVKTQKEMKSDKSSPQSPTAASSEMSEMKDQIQKLTSLISGLNVQNKPLAANDRQNTPDRNYNYPANGRQVNNDRNNFSGPCFKCQGRGHRQRECYWNVTSHPYILETDFLMKNNVVIDFSQMSCQLNTANVQTHKRLSLEPNTETIVWARVPNYITLGLQGVCSKSKFSCSKGLLLAKSVVTVPYNRKVPVKLLNPTSENVVIPKGRTIAEFNVLNKEYECASFSDTIPEVQHVDVSTTIDSPHSEFTRSKPDFSKVKSLFTLPKNLQETESDKLACLLHDNLDLFVTDDNPNLGFTRVVEHKILLKPDAVGKHQKPYRLPPYKREILREHFDNLLKQGIIAPQVVESLVEDDPFFPFVEDVCGKVKIPNGQNFSELIASKVVDVQAVHLTDNAYDADTLISDPYDADTDESDDNIRKKSVRKMSKQRRTMYKSDTEIDDKTLTTSVFENLSISTEKIKQLQRQNITLTKIIDYLENDTLPESQKEARRVLLNHLITL